jgi:hypothetical protein
MEDVAAEASGAAAEASGAAAEAVSAPISKSKSQRKNEKRRQRNAEKAKKAAECAAIAADMAAARAADTAKAKDAYEKHQRYKERAIAAAKLAYQHASDRMKAKNRYNAEQELLKRPYERRNNTDQHCPFGELYGTKGMWSCVHPNFPDVLPDHIRKQYLEACEQAIGVFQLPDVRLLMRCAPLLTALANRLVKNASDGERYYTKDGYTVLRCGIVPIGTSGTVTVTFDPEKVTSDSENPDRITFHPVYIYDNQLSVAYEQSPCSINNGGYFDTANLIKTSLYTYPSRMPIGFIIQARIPGESYSEVHVRFSPEEGTLSTGILPTSAAFAAPGMGGRAPAAFAAPAAPATSAVFAAPAAPATSAAFAASAAFATPATPSAGGNYGHAQLEFWRQQREQALLNLSMSTRLNNNAGN